MLKRLWSDHRNACLLTLAILVIGIVVSPWVLLAALLPVGWVLLKIKPTEDQPLTITEEAEAMSELPKAIDETEDPIIIQDEIKDLLSSSDSSEILQGLELLASTTNLISSIKDPNEDQDIE